MNNRLNALLIAIQFLTRLPVRVHRYPQEDLSRSLYWYGTVGLLIGCILFLLNGLFVALLPFSSTTVHIALVHAGLILLAWVLLTGALHLDGLADSADAWIGGQTAENALEIMKDPRCGPAGVVSIVLVLLLKFACLAVLLPLQPATIVLVPALARAAAPVLFLTTPYVRVKGLGSPFTQVDASACWIQAGLIVLVGTILCGFGFLAVVLASGLAFMLLRSAMMKKIGGLTGDTAGASIELLELTALLALILI